MKKHLLSLILLGVIVVLLFKECHNRNKISDLGDQVKLEKAFSDTLKVELNKKTGEIEYSKQTYAAKNDELSQFLSEKDKELVDLKKSKKAIVGIVTKTETRIDTIVKNIISSNVSDSIRYANIQNKHYTADIISWPNKTSLSLLAVDSVKYSLNKDYRLVATHSNPYLKVTELNSFYVKPEVKKKNWKYIVGGLVVGGIVYGITK